jgi:hypothetical protein
LLESSGLINLLRRARRRFVWHASLVYAAQALSVGIAGAILLLILGTEILEWYWPLALALVTALLCAGRVWLRIPSLYRLAQWLDRRLGFQDALSTAFYLLRLAQARRVSLEVRRQELAEAERLSLGVDLRRAMPIAAPRALYTSAVLALVASGLFALRYGVTKTLDLRPPIVRIGFHFHSGIHQRASLKAPARQLPGLLKEMGIPIDGGSENKSGVADGARDSRAQSVKIPDAAKDAAAKGKSANQANGGTKGAERDGQPDDGQDAGSAVAENIGNDGERNAQNQGAQTGESPGGPSAAKQNAGSSGEESSLINKMRDAMANLLSRLKLQNKGGQSKPSSSSLQSSAQNGHQRPSAAQKGGPGQGRNQSAGSPNGEPQGDQEASDGSQEAQAAQGQHGSQDGDQRPSKEGRSGVGRDDGAKDIKAAEQLAAMGQITEILGKRSQNVTGEVMVEVSSGKQQLQTPYTRRDAAHMDAGAEIHRDEIPLAYQSYVQQYFEEVRKAGSEKQEAGSKK